MATLDVYGEHTSASTTALAPLECTNLQQYGTTIRRFPEGAYLSRIAGWLPPTARAIARFLSRFYKRKAAFEKNMDPRQADELLDEWESAYAIDVPEGATVDDRRDAILAAVRALGGVTKEYYEALAADFGYPGAVVTELSEPFLCDSECTAFVDDLEAKVTMLVTAATQGATRDQSLQDLLNSQLLAGFEAVYEFI